MIKEVNTRLQSFLILFYRTGLDLNKNNSGSFANGHSLLLKFK